MNRKPELSKRRHTRGERPSARPRTKSKRPWIVRRLPNDNLLILLSSMASWRSK